ncbi:hypothetical protein APHCR_1545 [Anaplasma phagocytophilum str. CR1007]|nr:hypothetical protein APHCR_0015 [Anaplasma phagocytophilum str. CR1007]KKA00909.1 hypothetical protein APHCR_1530 [Anaplasma phagocytophilum str. CR1007]KKA00924.1 hypothetical protein APHCR_1545 [Anaplasma phagocytophilum str. CR1007]
MNLSVKCILRKDRAFAATYTTPLQTFHTADISRAREISINSLRRKNYFLSSCGWHNNLY